MSLASSGSLPRRLLGEIVAAYNDADIAELDILWEVEKDRRAGFVFLRELRKVSKKARIGMAAKGEKSAQGC